jgi:hypothetical protein
VRRRFRIGFLTRAVAVAVAAGALMLCYLRVAGTVPVLSDGAGNALEAWDMLHGDLLLRGWWVTDVSFYTTELPQYMLVELAAGLRPEVVHICAAMTYTLLVLLAAFVARGDARGADGAVRALLAAGIMLAPQPGAPAWVLLSDPDHVGTGVPALLLLVLLDRAPHRWYVPVCAAVLLAWSIVGDPLMAVIGSGPLALACLARTVWALPWRAGVRGADVRGAWYELSLAGAAIVAIPAAAGAQRLIRDLGGFQVNKGVSGVVPLPVIPGNAPLWTHSVLAIFGADYPAAGGGIGGTIAIAHLTGVALVLTAVGVAAWRLARPGGDLVAGVLVIAVVANLAAYLVVFRVRNIYAAHEIGPVLSLGAALAGRTLGGPLWRSGHRLRLRLRRRWRLAPGAVTGLACCALACPAAMLGLAAAGAQAPPGNAALAGWLARHDLRSGLAPYWEGTSVTLDSGGAIAMVSVVPVVSDRPAAGPAVALAARHWEADMRLADPAGHTADFVVVVPGGPVTQAQALAAFGTPARTYRYEAYTVLVWRGNLLSKLASPVSLG